MSNPLLTEDVSELRTEALQLSVAPMMEWTDRHCRYFHRLLAPKALLYTEMVTTGALLHGPQKRLLGHSAEEHPVALQLGGCEPEALAQCARLGEQAGYDEINLNLGCPSDRVQHARIGACLMREPLLVADAVSAMRSAVRCPVTVKCRLGVDNDDSFEFLSNLVATLASAGCTRFIVHARKALLSGLTPAQNRSIPALDYDRVGQLKTAFPHLSIIINGGIDNLALVQSLLQPSAAGPAVDGVMLGRAAYQNPWLLTQLSTHLHTTVPPASRHAIAASMLPYIEAHLADGGRLHDITRHMLGLFNGLPGARRFRRILSGPAARRSSTEALFEALDAVRERQPADASEHHRETLTATGAS